MIEQGGEYIFTIYDDDIRRLVSFDLSDGECTDIAYELESHFDDFVATWAREYRIDHPAKHDGVFVGGTLVRQEWVRDYGMTVGEVEFDCCLALDQYELSELPPCADDFHDKNYLNYGDELFETSVSLGLVPDWDGPFEMYVNPDDYDVYIAERVRREYGYEISER